VEQVVVRAVLGPSHNTHISHDIISNKSVMYASVTIYMENEYSVPVTSCFHK